MPDTVGPEHVTVAGSAPEDRGALPVVLSLSGRNAAAVHRWLEGVVGWQVVGEATPGEVPASLALVDHVPTWLAASGRQAAGGRSVPVVLLVDDEVSPRDAAELAGRVQPDAVVGWPGGRDQLADVGLDVAARARPSRTGRGVVRVGGASGGVGTSTVALALAGLHAWSGTRALALVRGNGHAFRAVDAAAVSDPELWSRADPLPGVPRARAVRLVGGDRAAEPSDPRPGAVVVDHGVEDEVDVLVCRRDAAALDAVATTTAGTIVVVDDGWLPVRRLRAAATGRRGILLPWSVRVARAGLDVRVPAGLPGAWVQRLALLVPGGARVEGRARVTAPGARRPPGRAGRGTRGRPRRPR